MSYHNLFIVFVCFIDQSGSPSLLSFVCAAVYLHSFRVTAAVFRRPPRCLMMVHAKRMQTSSGWKQIHKESALQSLQVFTWLWILWAEMQFPRFVVVFLGTSLDRVNLCFGCSPDAICCGKMFHWHFQRQQKIFHLLSVNHWATISSKDLKCVTCIDGITDTEARKRLGSFINCQILQKRVNFSLEEEFLEGLNVY